MRPHTIGLDRSRSRDALAKIASMQHPVPPRKLAIPGPFAHELIYTRGTRLHAATTGDPQAPLVLLLHDALGGWFDYRYLLPELASDFHAAAATARGFGQSDKPPSGYSLGHGVGDISSLIRALGHGKAIVVAHGSAARIATTLAASYPERVASVLILAGLSRRDPVAWRKHALLARASSRVPHAVAERSLPGADPETVRLRELSYRIAGTRPARLKHARLPGAPLPVGWTNASSRFIGIEDEPMHLLNPFACAALIRRQARAGS